MVDKGRIVIIVLYWKFGVIFLNVYIREIEGVSFCRFELIVLNIRIFVLRNVM